MIHLYENKDNIRILCGMRSLDWNNRIVLVKPPVLSEAELQKKRDELFNKYVFVENGERVNYLIAKWALTGRLKELKPELLEKAVEGKSIPFMNLHHIVPLSWGGTNDESNLTLINKNLHTFLHSKIYSAANKRLIEHYEAQGEQSNKPVEIWLPKLPPLIQKLSDIEDIFTPSEAETFRQEAVAAFLSRQNYRSTYPKRLKTHVTNNQVSDSIQKERCMRFNG